MHQLFITNVHFVFPRAPGEYSLFTIRIQWSLYHCTCQAANNKPERPTYDRPMADSYPTVTDTENLGHLANDKEQRTQLADVTGLSLNPTFYS